MQVNIAIDTSGLVAKTLREQKRLAFNMGNALNQTAKFAQADIRAGIQEHFHIRNTNAKGTAWLLQRIKIQFASVKKDLVYCEIFVDQKNRLLLGAFETGEMREGFVGKDSAVPTTAARDGSFANAIDPNLTFAKMRLKPFAVHSITQPDTVQFKGANRTFLLKHTAQNPYGGVYQRVGPGKDDIRLIYSFKPPFKLHEILNFVKTASAAMNDKFAVEWVIANARNPSV